MIPVCVDPLLAHCGRGGWRTVRPHRTSCFGSVCAFGGLGPDEIGSQLAVVLVVEASASTAEDPGFKSCLRRDFCGWSRTSDLKIGHPVVYPARRLAL